MVPGSPGLDTAREARHQRADVAPILTVAGSVWPASFQGFPVCTWAPGHSIIPCLTWILVSLTCLTPGTGPAPHQLPAQPVLSAHPRPQAHTVSIPGMVPQIWSRGRGRQDVPTPLWEHTPALCSLLEVPRNDFGLCQGEGAAPAASQAAELGCREGSNLQWQTILASSRLAATNFMPL